MRPGQRLVIPQRPSAASNGSGRRCGNRSRCRGTQEWQENRGLVARRSPEGKGPDGGRSYRCENRGPTSLRYSDPAHRARGRVAEPAPNIKQDNAAVVLGEKAVEFLPGGLREIRRLRNPTSTGRSAARNSSRIRSARAGEYLWTIAVGCRRCRSQAARKAAVVPPAPGLCRRMTVWLRYSSNLSESSRKSRG